MAAPVSPSNIQPLGVSSTVNAGYNAIIDGSRGEWALFGYDRGSYDLKVIGLGGI